MITHNEWVLVRTDQDQFQDISSKNGILMVEDMPKLLTGTVLSPGKGIKMKKGVSPPQLKVGEKIIFQREKRNLTENDREFLVRESDIIGVIDEED